MDRREADREAHEQHMQDTYEERYAAFCRDEWLDPEDVASVLSYEEEFEWQTSEGGRR